MYNYTYLHNVPDRKDDSGQWLMTFSEEKGVYQRTRSFILWQNVEKRTHVSARETNQHLKRYTECVNKFESYQRFTDWCQEQYGYMLKEGNGKFWSLDKDILIYGNKVYSHETCIFVPQSINSLLAIKRQGKLDSLPTGVHWSKRDGKYQANGIFEGKQKFLGYYDNVEEAHKAWLVGKIQEIKRVCDSNTDVLGYEKLRMALLLNAERIQDDLDSNKQTF